MEVAKAFGKLGFPLSVAKKFFNPSTVAFYCKGMKSWWWLPTSVKHGEAPLTSLAGGGDEGEDEMSHYGAFCPLGSFL